MRLDTLKKALRELEAEQNFLTSAIENLKAIIEGASSRASENGRRPSYVDFAVEAINASGKDSLHIGKIIEYIHKRRGAGVPRASVEATLSNHVKSMKEDAKIVKIKRATYALARNC